MGRRPNISGLATGAGRAAFRRRGTEAGQRPLVRVHDDAAEGDAALQPAQPSRAGDLRHQVVEAPVRPVREQLVGDAVARRGRHLRLFEQA